MAAARSAWARLIRLQESHCLLELLAALGNGHLRFARSGIYCIHLLLSWRCSPRLFRPTCEQATLAAFRDLRRFARAMPSRSALSPDLPGQPRCRWSPARLHVTGGDSMCLSSMAAHEAERAVVRESEDAEETDDSTMNIIQIERYYA